MVPPEIIESYPHITKKVERNTFLFHEGDSAYYYYQIITGRVRMLNINDEGKEFVQGIFENGQSFGEPPLFHSAPYPASARTISDTQLYKVRKDHFLQLLKDHFDIHLKFTAILTKRLMYKAMIMKEISNHDVEHRILAFLDHLKKDYGNSEELFELTLTRQQLATVLGVRVETVIRAVKHLEEKDDLKIIGRKVYR